MKSFDIRERIEFEPHNALFPHISIFCRPKILTFHGIGRYADIHSMMKDQIEVELGVPE